MPLGEQKEWEFKGCLKALAGKTPAGSQGEVRMGAGSRAEFRPRFPAGNEELE